MTALASRLRRLERPIAGICRECGGKGKLVVSYMAEGEPTPVPEGCPNCGQAQHLIVLFRDENLPGQTVKSGCKLSGKELEALYA